MNSEVSQSLQEAVAVIGMSGRWPGARNTAELWKNLLSRVDSISRFRPEDLECSVASQPARGPDQKYVAARGVLEDVELFDAAFFGIYPREAEVMDPQHRFFLECAWEALEVAGYDSETFPGLIGVYAGTSLNTYLLYNLGQGKELAANYQVADYQVMLGNDKDFLPTRVSYKLNLRGPSMAIQCACSTSLVAVAQACQALLGYQCDMALAGGVSISFPQRRDYAYQEDGMVSLDGTCRAFDAEARGTVFGHGGAVVLLKRFADAVSDGDHILAVIRGSAVNNDGSAKIGYAAPSVTAQAEVITMAQAAAGIDPESVSYIEAHGTGTPLGDPIEVAALTQAFRNGGARRNGFCALGTGKTHLSHLDVAAGATGLIKTILQLQHEQIPALLHFKSPNAKIDFSNSPFYPVASLTEWPRGGSPRRAGVSAFGVGGTNAHVVVEEAPALEPTGDSRPVQLVVVSAKTQGALEVATKNLADHLESEGCARLADVAFTLHRGRRPFAFRRAVVADTAANAVAYLRSGDGRKAISGQAPGRQPSVVFLFPGQGAQYVGMAGSLYSLERVFRDHVDRCAELLQERLGLDIRGVLFPDETRRAEADRQINETWLTQPAIFIVEYAMARLWMSWGIQPSVVIGHSIGEYVCAVLAGTFSLEDALALLSVRARLMQSLPAGSMLAVRLGAAELAGFLPAGAEIAAINSPSLSTVSGPTRVLQALEKELAERKVPARFLPTSHAFHSAMMDPILTEFTAAAAATACRSPSIRWVSTCTGRWMTAEDLNDPSYWARQLRQTVRFGEAIERVLGDANHILLEVGPGQSLSQFARQHPAKPSEMPVVSSLGASSEPDSEWSLLLAAMGRLWVAGVRPNWEAFYRDERRRRVPLPTYPFERKRFWIEPGQTAGQRPAVAGSARAEQTAGTTSDATSAACSCTAPSAVPASNVTLPDSPPGPGSSLPMTTPASSTSGARRESIAAQVRAGVKELSGIEIQDDKTSFMELGFDSLFLTQASQAFQTRFGVKITFRQLLDELSSVAALAAYLDGKLPAEAPALTAPAAAPVAPPSGAAPVGLVPAGGSMMEQLLLQQVNLMQLMLAQQRGQTLPPALVPTSAPAIPAAAGGLSVVRWPGPKPPGAASSAHQQEFKRFGPYKPIEKGEKGGLTARQQKALDELVARYVKRTHRSKEYTAEHRPHFADPRAVSGFKSNWKEMVYPIVCSRSKGSRLWDLDDNEYVDITMGFGTYFFGHSPDWLMPALEEQLRSGIEIGPQNPLAGKVARLVTEFTGLERVTFCNTGSEAVMAAMRLARTVTGRKRVVYFNGDYHGMFEEVLVRGAWVDGEYRAQPIAPGIPGSLAENMLVLEYGAPESLEIIKTHAAEIAAVMVEPVQSRNPSLQPRAFLHELRALTQRHGIALVFDEVVTGFRCHPGGAQAYFGVQADMATYGKVVGGGIPIGVLAGRKRFMDPLDGGGWSYGDDSFPEVGVTFFAGTFVRHPLAMAAAWRVLNYLRDEGPKLQSEMTSRVDRLCRTLDEHFEKIEVPIRLPHFSAHSMIEFPHDLKYGSLLWYYLREKGVHVWEGRPCFFTLAHSDADFDRVIRGFKESVAEMQEAGFLPESPAGTSRLGAPSGSVPDFPRLDSSPLTEAQREIFFSVQMGDDANCAYNEASVIHFEGPLRVDILKRSLVQVIERHPALRSTISQDGATQIFHPSPSVISLPVEDLSPLPETERRTRFEALLRAETSTPLNLVEGPLLRLQLVQHSSSCYGLLFTAHHMVCDGWSFGMIVAELCAIYNAMEKGRVPVLPPAMSFGDFARIIKEQGAAEESLKAEAHWLKVFQEHPPVLELPTDRPRPTLKTYRAGMESWRIPDEVFAKLKKRTPALGGTVFSSLLAAFGVLLHRLTGQEDVVVGIAAAGQTRIGCSELVGHCLNLLPVRLRPTRGGSFDEFAKSVRETVLDAYDHQHMTYGTLIRKLNLPRDTSRLPLVSVLFNIDKSGFDLSKFEGLDFRVETNAKQFTNFELFFNLVQTETTLEVECEYNTDLFDAATIRAWLAAYETLIISILDAPGTALGQLAVLSPEQLSAVTKGYNRANEAPFSKHLPLDGGATLQALFGAQASRTPENVAITSGSQHLTYQELDVLSTRLAQHLVEMGIQPGTLAGIYMDRGVDLIVSILGVLKAGGAYLPIDLAYPPERVAFMLEDSRATIVITQSALRSSLPRSGSVIVCLDEPLNSQHPTSKPADTTVATGPDHLAYVIYTSGTTGKPKGSLITHRNVVRLFASTERWFGFDETDVWTLFHSHAFDFSVWEIFGALLYGGRLVVVSHVDSRSPDVFYRLVCREKVTVLNQTPSAFRMFLAAEDSVGPGALALRYVIFGGEALEIRGLEPWFARHGDARPQLVNMYGITETTVHVTYRPLTKADLGRGSVIGRPIPDLQMYVLDGDLKPQIIGVPGELYVGGAGLGRGYLNRPDLTAERFLTDHISGRSGARLYRTGDLARYTSGGDVEYLGRVDNQVKIRGFRIELGEIEVCLRQHPGIKQAVVVAREGQIRGQKALAGYYVSATGEGIPQEGLRAHLAANLPEYMIPAWFVAVQEIPMTTNGKLDVHALPVPAEADVPRKNVFSAPQTAPETALADIWSEVLNRPKVGTDDDVFELGGDSLSVFRITTRAAEAGWHITAAEVFRLRTVRKLAAIARPVSDAKPGAARIPRLDRESLRRKRMP